MSHCLVILGCGRQKRRTSRLLPAIERYDGPTFRVLRRHIAELPERAPSTRVLSARFGLVAGDLLIPRYDRVLRPAQVPELRKQVAEQLARTFDECRPTRIFVSVGAHYWPLLSERLERRPRSIPVTVAHGGIGGRASRLWHWLQGDARQTVMNEVGQPPGEATLLGTTVRKTPAEILDIARRSLAREPVAARRFETWYVPVDHERVAPKWLVGLLFSKPVVRFRTADANRVLAQLGLEVLHTCQSRVISAG